MSTPFFVVEAARLADPDWIDGGRVHNWRNHVGERVRAIWHTFTEEQRLAIAADADDRAGDEDWE